MSKNHNLQAPQITEQMTIRPGSSNLCFCSADVEFLLTAGCQTVVCPSGRPHVAPWPLLQMRLSKREQIRDRVTYNLPPHNIEKHK